MKLILLIGVLVYLLILGSAKAEERKCKRCHYHSQYGCVLWECEKENNYGNDRSEEGAESNEKR